MLLLWGLVLSINILFRHAHRLPNGRIVSHVHPFKWTGEKGPLPYNPHTSSELSWLDAQSNGHFLSDLPEVFTLESSAAYPEQTTHFSTPVVFSIGVGAVSPRGPPVRLS